MYDSLYQGLLEPLVFPLSGSKKDGAVVEILERNRFFQLHRLRRALDRDHTRQQ
jgi:hypothetical protein